ncbi:hypothetical protein E4849_23545 [Salmonella enterica subsp. enterica serovar Anatum]|uniref:Uncharacterized protein n=1 Tax=Salmonella phage 9NA TaxID=1113547 RepID=A0A060D566_9CAUD|nr:hypothetical protein ST9NA_016 [Salmonella phage 9NA]EBA5048669.1 hypothetical protein [Salmonella enterica]EDO3063842.1 hypothetical protein [Salmonella enterica subsp. enterica serovar Anatum]AIB07019.1 hypothetical protein 9NA_016 [Salmonella phage 9NA]KAA7525377.1 hypothetical protein E4850_23530 [Salmonella enterica subsp. enterica serovar Anatum]KAA7538308.1 hypothetical protein E4849_23545 [Salmonella enterica subsp. enterica serovar Anatum]
MEYLIAAISILLMIVVVVTTEKKEQGVIGLAVALLRVLSIALLMTSFSIAFDIIELQSDYYGFVKFQHQLTYAIIFGLGSVSLAVLSSFRR